MSKQEEIIEVAGKKVRVAYCKPEEDACGKCCFNDGIECTVAGVGGEKKWPCVKFDLETAYFVSAEETHSLREWAQILATNPDLRAEFDKLCPPQPIQGSIAPEADVDKWAVTNAFLHCEKAGKIVSEMYGDKLNNPRNRDKYLVFLQQVKLDDRFGELAEILQRYGAMPTPKEQQCSVTADESGEEYCKRNCKGFQEIGRCYADGECDAKKDKETLRKIRAEIERWWNERYAEVDKNYKFDSTSGHYLDNETIIALAHHFAEWSTEHLKR